MTKITSYAIFPVSLPDEDPEWKFAGRAYPKWDACVVALKAEDGTIGYGYAAAFTHLGATNPGVEAALHEPSLPLVIGRGALDIEGSLRIVDKAIQGNQVAKSGIDCALYDLAANLLEVPLNQLFRRAPQSQSRSAACSRSRMPPAWPRTPRRWSMKAIAH